MQDPHLIVTRLPMSQLLIKSEDIFCIILKYQICVFVWITTFHMLERDLIMSTVHTLHDV